MNKEELAHKWVNDGDWGNPIDKTGQWMFDKLVEAFIAGYEAHTEQKLNIHGVMQGLLLNCSHCQGTGIEPNSTDYSKPPSSSPTVGQRSGGTVAEAGVDKWCDSCGKVTRWVNDECVNYTKKKAEALTRSNRD